MNDSGSDHDAMKDAGGSNNAEDDIVSEIVPTTIRSDMDRHERREGRQVRIGVGLGVLLLAILLGILIPTVFLNHESPGANAEALQDLDTGRVRCWYWLWNYYRSLHIVTRNNNIQHFIDH
jgi:hypothetical protein